MIGTSRFENEYAPKPERFPALPCTWAIDVGSREFALDRNWEDEMKLPRRQFLRLAAGAAVLPATRP